MAQSQEEGSVERAMQSEVAETVIGMSYVSFSW